jgi:UrcA family protein
MLRNLLSAALVTLVAAVPAASAGDAPRDSHSYVIALGEVDATNPADVERVMRTFTDAARKACMATGTRIANSRCVKKFVAEAIGAVRRPDLQVALMEGDVSGGGVPRTASAPNRQ